MKHSALPLPLPLLALAALSLLSLLLACGTRGRNSDPHRAPVTQPVPETPAPISNSPVWNKTICSAAGWCWENPLPQGNHIEALWGFAQNEVWAVGEKGTILQRIRCLKLSHSHLTKDIAGL